MTWKKILLGTIAQTGRGSIDPRKTPKEIFDLYSIPAFDSGEPERLLGGEIGSAKKRVEENDLLLSRIVPHIRRTWVVKKSSGNQTIASSEWMVFRDRDVDPDFLRHILVSDDFHRQFMSTVSGVGGSLLRARPTQVYEIEVPIPFRNGNPDLEEQKRIAAILDKADGIRRKRGEALKLADDFVRSLFLDMFGDPVTNPKGWERRKMADITSIEAPMVSPLDDEYKDLLHYGPDRIEKDTGELLSASTAEEDGLISGKFLCHPGEVFYSKIRPNLNKVAMVKERCLCSADVYPVKPREKVLTKEYLWALLTSKAFLDYVGGFSRRANIPKVNRVQFGGYDAPVPPFELQRQFSTVVAILERKKQKMRSKEFGNLFSSLQQRAFKGGL